MYIVYKHTFKTTGKSYIGYTSKSMHERFEKHVLNSIAGMDNHFYRAIRKYGVDDIVSEVLYECETKDEATEKEKFYIDKYNTFNEGYNMTKGGDGGWVVPSEKYDSWVLLRSHPMEKNGRFSGFSDDEILKAAHDYFAKNGYNINGFKEYSSKKYGMPKSYSKNRFNGKSFKKAYSEKYNVPLNEIVYKQTDDHKVNNSKTYIKKGCKWYHNNRLKQSKQFFEKPNNEWKLGRKIKWD